MNYCKCGCGALVKGTWKQGHYSRSEEHKKMLALKVHPNQPSCSEEKKKKIAKSVSEDWKKHDYSERKKKISESVRKRWEEGVFDNVKWSEEGLESQRENGKRLAEEKKKHPEWEEKRLEAIKNREITDEERERMAERLRQRWADPEVRAEISRKISESSRGKHLSDEHKENVRRGIIKKFMDDPDYARRVAAHDIPNKKEKRLLKLLDELFPNQYKFTGDFSFWVDKQNPDFVNCNGQKKVIEHFGDYYHGEEKTGKPNAIHEEERKAKYGEFGFDCLVVWEHELENEEELRKKLIEFHNE